MSGCTWRGSLGGWPDSVVAASELVQGGARRHLLLTLFTYVFEYFLTYIFFLVRVKVYVAEVHVRIHYEVLVIDELI